MITNLIKKTGFKRGNSFCVSLVQKSVTKLTFLCQIPGKQCRCTLNFYSQLKTTNPAANSGTEPYTFRDHPFLWQNIIDHYGNICRGMTSFVWRMWL